MNIMFSHLEVTPYTSRSHLTRVLKFEDSDCNPCGLNMNRGYNQKTQTDQLVRWEDGWFKLHHKQWARGFLPAVKSAPKNQWTDLLKNEWEPEGGIWKPTGD